MKLNLKSKFYKILLSFALLLTTAQAVFASGEDNILGNESINVITEKIYDKETNTVDIKLTLEAKNTNVSLEGVTFPDESKKIPTEYVKEPEVKSEDNTYIFTVRENGEYEFQANYALEVVGEDEQPLSREETYGFKVNVSEVENTTNLLNEKLAKPVVENTDRGVTLRIPDYDGVSWSNGSVKNIYFKVDFGDTTSENKKIVLTLPDGMKFTQINVAGEIDRTDIDESLLLNDPALNDALIGVSIPKVEYLGTNKTYKTTYGTIEYIVAAGVKEIEINVKASVDPYKYYGAHTISDPIGITAYKGKQLLGTATSIVNASGTQIGSGRMFRFDGNISPSTELLPSSGQEISYGQTASQRLELYGNVSGIPETRRFAKSGSIYYYYPQGMEFSKFNIRGNSSGAIPTIEHQESLNRVKVTFENQWYSLFEGNIEYIVPEGTVPGIYVNSEFDYAEYTFYDGTTQKVTSSNSKINVEVIDPSLVVNELNVLLSEEGYTDNTLGWTHQYGPKFTVQNITAGKKTNQLFEIVIDPNWQVSMVRIPYDRAENGGGYPTRIEYQTNLDSSWRTYEPQNATELQQTAGLVSVIKDKVGLSENEFFTSVRAEVGNFSQNYSTKYSNNSSRTAILSTFGTLAKNVSSATVELSIYEKNNPSSKTTTLGTVYGVEQSSGQSTFNSGINYRNTSGEVINQVMAGDTIKISANLGLQFVKSTYPFMQAPEIYLRQPAQTTLNINSLEIKDWSGETIDDWTYSTHVNTNGETIYKIITPKTVEIGLYDETMKARHLIVSYDLSTDVKLVGEINSIDLLAWGNNRVTPVGYDTNMPFKDIHDFNGNGDTTDLLFSLAEKYIQISDNKNVIVETFLTLEGEEPKGAFNENNPDTKAYFTPGTNADYTAKITNNGDVPADEYTVYIPIPKTGKSFGPKFQGEVFNWDMILSGDIKDVPNFEVLYSSTASEDNYEDVSIYSNIKPSNDIERAAVNMVKIVSTKPISPSDIATFKIPLKVNETLESAFEDNKIGKMNIYNPVYDVVSEKFSGTLAGTKVGVELIIAEIGGIIFQDVDVDGLYNPAKGDKPISGHKVELYIWDDASSSYVGVLDENNETITVESNSDGVYIFDHNVGMNVGNYAVRFVELSGGVYEYTINSSNPNTKEIDSNAIINSDIPNSGDNFKGWAINIDPTHIDAKTIGAGFISYNPPIDLTVSITGPTEVKSGESITLKPESITPEFWNSIKHPNNAYSWSIVGDAGEQAKASLTVDQATGDVRLTAATLAKGKTTVKVKLTIHDIYGNEAESNELEITILSTEKPVITVVTNPTMIEYGETALDEAAFIARAGISAKDNEGTEISFTTDFDSVVDQTVLDDYTVTITATDSFGNTATRQVTVTVQDKTPPVITLAKDTHTVEMAPEVTFESIIAAFDAKATDNYDPSVTVTNNIAEVVKLDTAGTYIVTFTATDSNGNTATKTAKVVIKDETPPVISFVNGNVVIEINSGKTHADVLGMIGATATDNSGETITVLDNLASIVKLDTLGTYTVNFTAEDSNGNKASKTATVKVQDTIPPVINVAILEKTVEINGADTHASILAEINATVTDNSKETITIIDTITEVKLDTVGTYYVTFNAKDSSGNEAIEVVVKIIVVDTKGPEITIANPEVSIEINGGTTEAEFIKLAGIDATDNSGEKPTITTDFDTIVNQTKPGDYTVIITAEDSEGNQTTEKVIVTVEDTIAPVITVVNPEVSIEINGGTTEEDIIKLAGIDATDNSGETPTITTDFDTAVNQTKPGKYDVIITATDGAGNSSTETIIVTIEDTTDPEITIAKPEVSIEINGGTTEEDIIKLAGIDATDNSGETPTITTDFDTVVNQTEPGDYTVTITVTDSAGNVTTDTIVVTVEDTTSPDLVLTNKEVEINLNNPITEAEFMAAVGASASDNSLKPVKVTSDFDQVVDQNNPLGVYTVTITATDETGNVTTETVTIKILDDENPTVSGGEEYSYVVGGEITLEQLLDDIGFVATDNSDQTLYPVSITSDIDQVDFNTIGSYDVTITVTDVSGNITQHIVTINVVREATHHIVGDRVIIDVNDLGAILALDDVEGKIIELVNGKAWIDDAITGITDLPVFIKNYEEMIKFLSRKDLKNGDVFDVVLTTNNPLSRSPFGSETVAQIEITGVVDTPKLPSTGVAANNTTLYGGLVAIFSGMFLLFAKKKKEDEETAN